MKFILFIGAFFVLSTSSLFSVENEVVTKTPVKHINDQYQIFPDLDLGNSLYKDQTLLFRNEKLALFDVHEVPDGFLYAGKDASGDLVIGYQGGPDTKFLSFKKGYYQLILERGISKLYRVSNGKIQDLLPRYITANGMVVSEDGRGAFFHISKGEIIEDEEGLERYQYTFKIHIVEPESEQVINIPLPITDYRSRLKMHWSSEHKLEYSLSDGMTGQVNYR